MSLLHHPIMTYNFFHLLLLLVLLLRFSTANGDSSSIMSFSVDIVHRNSLYETTNSIVSTVIPNNADHLMTFSIGTPPVQVHAVIDTGSDLIWTRCIPCADCVGRQVPSFDPSRSSTYQNLPCNSPLCNFLDPSSCSNDPTACQYTYAYGDSSFTRGVLATETLSFDSTDGPTVSFPSIGFGCGHNNSDSLDGSIIGIVGFGRGESSLITQLGPSIGWRFSYCLVPFQEATSTSVMNFGDNAVISGDNVVSTPLVSDGGTFYFVTLERISVGGVTIDASEKGTGNIFIDSGTTVSLLNTRVFNELADAVTDIVRLPRRMDAGNTFVCFETTSRDGFPTITFHFAGGADVALYPLNTFTVPSAEGLTCLAMQATDGTAIFGNLVQQNLHVSYDLKGETVSFAPADCSKVG